jgi:hypothetical protein
MLPEDLGEMSPGPELAALLASIDRSRLNGFDLVTVLQAQARQVAHEQARLLADLVAVAHCPPGGPDAPVARSPQVGEFAADEIRAALTWTRRAADDQLALALTVVERLPAVHAALAAGEIDIPRARVICEAVAVLAESAARAVAGEVLGAAGGLTTGQLRARLRRLVIERDPGAAARRCDEAVARRRMERELLADGTAFLAGTHLPAARAAAAAARVDALAWAAKRAGDGRSLDQLRADTFLDLLEGVPTGHRDAGGRGSVELTVPLTTLMGLADEPGELAGWGPVVADVARRVAEQQRRATWRLSVCDAGGRLLWHGVTRRRPDTATRQFVKARDRTCRAPGCRAPSQRADLDHIRHWAAGGATTRDNLAVLCRHDHRLKHDGGWRHRQIAPGVFAWTSALGHTYLVGPDRPPGTGPHHRRRARAPGPP